MLPTLIFIANTAICRTQLIYIIRDLICICEVISKSAIRNSLNKCWREGKGRNFKYYLVISQKSKGEKRSTMSVRNRSKILRDMIKYKLCLELCYALLLCVIYHIFSHSKCTFRPTPNQSHPKWGAHIKQGNCLLHWKKKHAWMHGACHATVMKVAAYVQLHKIKRGNPMLTLSQL